MFVSLQGISQKQYRISSIISDDCNNSILYVYDSELGTKLLSVKYEDMTNNLFYDNDERLIKMENYYSDNTSSTIEYTYNSKGLLLTVYNKSNGETINTTSYTYDNQDLLISLKDNSSYTELKYNNNGLIEEKIVSYFANENVVSQNKSVFFYENNKLIKSMSYYKNGNEWQLNPLYIIYEYDALGNCKSISYIQDDNVVYKTDYEFYEDIKYDDVYYFVNPSLVDPEPSYVNAISKSIISYSNSSPCTNLYTYENLSNSIEEKTSTLHVYPNPVENYVRIKGNDIYRIELLDIYGRILSIQQIESFVNIDMSKYNVGIYYIKAYNNSGSFTKKIVKK